eukprot:g25965.t1
MENANVQGLDVHSEDEVLGARELEVFEEIEGMGSVLDIVGEILDWGEKKESRRSGGMVKTWQGLGLGLGVELELDSGNDIIDGINRRGRDNHMINGTGHIEREVLDRVGFWGGGGALCLAFSVLTDFNGFTCTSTNLVYCIRCSRSGLLSIGETKHRLGGHFVEHLRSICNHRHLPIMNHFNFPSHSLSDMSILGLLQCHNDTTRKLEEQHLIFCLGS